MLFPYIVHSSSHSNELKLNSNENHFYSHCAFLCRDMHKFKVLNYLFVQFTDVNSFIFCIGFLDYVCSALLKTLSLKAVMMYRLLIAWVYFKGGILMTTSR